MKINEFVTESVGKIVKGAYKIKKFADRAGIKLADKVVK